MSLFKDKTNWKNPLYSRGEEIANSITHGIGAALSIAGLTAVVGLAVIYGDVWRVVSFSIYGGSLILLYLASTLYHSLQPSRVKQILRKFDHAAIYVLIAGTYTPFLLVSMRGSLGWPLFVLIWGMATAGIVWKMFFLGKLEVLATVIYILMGWMCVFLFKDMMATIPLLGLKMLSL